MTHPEALSPRTVEGVYRALGARLLAYAVSLSGRRDLAEDALHDLFVRLAADPALLSSARDPAAYCFASLRRAVIEAARRERRWWRLRPAWSGSEIPSTLRPASSGELSEAECRKIEEALASLSAEEREIVTLKVWGGLTFAQAAEATGVSPRTLESRYYAALDRLRERLKGTGGVDE